MSKINEKIEKSYDGHLVFFLIKAKIYVRCVFVAMNIICLSKGDWEFFCKKKQDGRTDGLKDGWNFIISLPGSPSIKYIKTLQLGVH